jgi:GTP-binding protein
VLYRKPRWLVLNKLDQIEPENRKAVTESFIRSLRWRGRYFAISALTGDGCSELTYETMRFLESPSAESAT